jgi:hypothetical protein
MTEAPQSTTLAHAESTDPFSRGDAPSRARPGPLDRVEVPGTLRPAAMRRYALSPALMALVSVDTRWRFTDVPRTFRGLRVKRVAELPIPERPAQPA